METVNNVVNQASKLIWGEGNTKQTEEPISGQTGAGTVTEPYDKGNTDASNTSSTTTGTTPNPSSTMASTSTSTSPSATTNPSTNDPATAAHSTITEPGQKQQGADRPTEEPSAAQTEIINDKSNVAESQQQQTGSDHRITDEEREKLAEKGELPKIPGDDSGEPMHMHGGASKATETEEDTADPRTEGKKDRSASVAHEGGGQHGKIEGTGEQWVKTSGLAAEGGDFDATKPGAGKEANRLLEERGIKKDDSGKMATEDGTSPDLGGSEDVKKESKIAKLKEKLHIGHKKE